MGGQWDHLGAAPSHDLVAAIGRLDGGIEELAVDFGPAQTFQLNQVAERLPHFGVQNVGKLIGVIAVGRSQDEGLHGSQ